MQYAIAASLNHPYIKKDLQRITKIKLFVNKYNLKKIGIVLRKIINQLLLIYYLLLTILDK